MFYEISMGPASNNDNIFFLSNRKLTNEKNIWTDKYER